MMRATLWVIAPIMIAATVGALPTSPAKILMSPSSLFPDHRLIMRELASELVRRGHHVIWWEIGLSKPTISLPDGVEERFWLVDVNEGYINNLFKHRNASVFDHIFSPRVTDVTMKAANWMASLRMCEEILDTRKADFDALVAEKFTTAIIDDLYNPCGMLHVALQKSVYIYWSLSAMRTETAWSSQSPAPPSYVPVPGTHLTDDLTFWQRSYNLMQYVKQIYIHQRIVLRRIDAVFQRHYPGVADAFTIERNASLNYINTPSIFDFPRAFMPRVCWVGGLHCHKPRNLTGDLRAFVEAHQTVYLFTTGHAVQWQKMPTEITSMFIGSFNNRPDIGFVWQYEGDANSNLPKNVFVAPWLPQQDILGHKHTKGFITHGGLNSVVEAMYHGVPVIGLPLLTEHTDNLLRLTARGAGFLIRKEDISERTLTRAYDKLLEKSSYKEAALEFQDLILDVPYTELNHSAFWVEFIQRHQEIPHARSGADDLNIVQYFLIDVIVFCLSLLVLAILAVIFCIRACCRTCFKVCLGDKKEKQPVSKEKKTN